MRTRGATFLILFLLTILRVANAATETQISQAVIDPEPFRTRTVVASSGNGYLVAWGAVGAGRNEDLNNTPPMTIYIRAVGADGIPLQQSATAVGKGELPSIAWNGHEYLVVWGITTPTTGTLPTPSLVGIRVREDGTLIDPVPVTLIAEVNPYSYLASVTWSGSQYLVTWTRGAALVDRDLHVKQVFLPVGIPLYSASSGGDFIVLPGVFYGSTQSLFVVPVSSAGNPSTPIPLEGAYARIANIDGGYFVLWGDVGSALHATRLRADGTTISTSPFYLQLPFFPTLAARDGRIMAAWQTDKSSICTARIDNGSQPVCSNPQQHQAGPVIGIASNSVLLAWKELTNDGDVIRVAISSSGEAPQADNNVGRIISDPQLRAGGAAPCRWRRHRGVDRIQPNEETNRSSHRWNQQQRRQARRSRCLRDATRSSITGRVSGRRQNGDSVDRRGGAEDPDDDHRRRQRFTDRHVVAAARCRSVRRVQRQGMARDLAIRHRRRGPLCNRHRRRIRPLHGSGARDNGAARPVGAGGGVEWKDVLSRVAGTQPRADFHDQRRRCAVGSGDARFQGRFSRLAVDGRQRQPRAGGLGPNRQHTSRSGVRRGWQAGWEIHRLRLAGHAHAHPHACDAERIRDAGGSTHRDDVRRGRCPRHVRRSAVAGRSDFVVDPANRFTFIYARLIGRGSSANFAQTIGLARRRPQNR